MDEQPSGWAIGFTAFAGIMMIVMGIWWIMAGLVAVLNSEFFVVTFRWIFQFDVSAWGWIHLLLGILILVAGFFLFAGAIWARVVGVILAVLSALVAFAWLPYYPFWALLFVALSVGVIWALTVHGRDITEV
jgi:hypothetical protein